MKIIIALALLGRGAQAQINTLKYTQVGVGACRGNGGPADKVSGVYTQGQTQAWCEQQCDLQPDCVGYAFHVGQSDPALAWCLVHSPTIAGSCSNPAMKTKEKCLALGGCSGEAEDRVKPCGLDGVSDCLGHAEACEHLGGTWKSAGATWDEPMEPWTSDSHTTTHIHDGNGNADYFCYDIDLDDHQATCVNGVNHEGYGHHGGYLECAAKWTDTSVDGCVDVEGCPSEACNTDDTEAWCCNAHVDDCSEWHYCGCERDFEAADTYEEKDCDLAAGCVYTPAPKMEKVVVAHGPDQLKCDNVYMPGVLGACRGTDENGAQVGANSKYSNSCDIEGKKKPEGSPTGMTQAECEAGCAAENARSPGACIAYHHGAWCSIFGPDMDTGIGIDDADPCWVANPYDAKEVTGTNTNIAYLCWMVKDATQTCDASSSDGDDGPAATSKGSCYEFATHAVTCDVAAADCGDGKAHYEPGFVGSSGCCHCEASCDHSQESGTDCTYYDAQGDGDDHGGGSDAAECAFDAPESKPFGPCQASDTYPLFCTAAEAEAMSPSNGHHMMAGLFMPNGVDPMCHGNYVGDATACECEDATKNDGGSDGALRATMLGYGAIAAAALLA